MASASVSLPVYMRLGNRGREHLVGYVTWDFGTGEGTHDLSLLEQVYPQMMDDSPELRELGIVRDSAPGEPGAEPEPDP